MEIVTEISLAPIDLGGGVRARHCKKQRNELRTSSRFDQTLEKIIERLSLEIVRSFSIPVSSRAASRPGFSYADTARGCGERVLRPQHGLHELVKLEC
jgi:hypothetical protein